MGQQSSARPNIPAKPDTYKCPRDVSFRVALQAQDMCLVLALGLASSWGACCSGGFAPAIRHDRAAAFESWSQKV